MPLQKLQFRPGLNREGTDYSNEGGWYDGDKIRFRSGFPEKIGGWTQYSPSQFLGIARSLWIWLDADAGAGNVYVGVGTSSKYYIYFGGAYNDITPIVHTSTLSGTSPYPFTTIAPTTLNGTITATATSITLTSAASFPAIGTIRIGSEDIYYTAKSSNTLTGCVRGYNGTTAASYTTGVSVYSFSILVGDTSYNPGAGDYVYFASAYSVGGAAVTGDYKVDVVPYSTTYYMSPAVGNTLATWATSSATYSSSVTAQYEYPSGLNLYTTGLGWGAGPWSRGTWGSAYSISASQQLRLWSNDNFGSDLVIAPRGGPIFYWQDSSGVTTRAQYLSTLANTTTLVTDASTFSSGVTSITVTAGNAPYIYPYMYITGTGIPAGTYVSSSYLTGSTTVPLTFTAPATATTANSSGTYNFSYAGSFVPIYTYQVITSAIQEFVIAFGSNPYSPNNASTTFNPMLVRWSDQANPYQWVPTITNQSGEYTLSNGSFIMAARATRQEILVWTDSAIYSMQYLGAPYVWGFQILMDNISVMSPNSMITVNNVTYWMGRDRFYMYSGRVEVLPCALRQYIFDDINQDQSYQVFAGANEAYNEVWWFYVSNSSGATSIDKYIIYNYLDRVWYYGTMARTAWLQSGTQQYPIAADYNGRLLNHEIGCDDVSTSAALPIDAYVQSSDFDIGDGHNFGFVWRILPDVNFNGSTVNAPSVTMTVKQRQNSGTPYGQADNPQVVSAQNYTVLPQYTIQQFTGQVYTRLRGRQMAFRIESTGLGVAWQLGSPRIDIRPDGRR